VAKVALIERELKRERLVAKFAKKYADLKAIVNNAKNSDEQRKKIKYNKKIKK